MARHCDRGGRKPYILKSFITGAIHDLRKDKFVYVRTIDLVQAIQDGLEPYEEITAVYKEDRYAYRLKMKEREL